MDYLVADLNKKMRIEGNMPSVINGEKQTYATRYGTGVIQHGMIFGGQCTICGISFYIYQTGFVAKFENINTKEKRYMVLGKMDTSFIPSDVISPLTVNQILATIYRSKFDSQYVNTFKISVCDILSTQFMLSKFQQKLILLIKFANIE